MKPFKRSTQQEVLDGLARKGLSIRKWSILNGFHPATVSKVIRGCRGTRIGKGHRIAVMLGLKEGEPLET
jgi:gp16 family phage-associated protein